MSGDDNVVRVVLRPGQRLEVSYVEPAVQVAREAGTVEEIAQRYGSSPRQVRRLIACGVLAASRPAGARAFTIAYKDAERAFAPAPPAKAKLRPPADDSDAALVERLEARGIRSARGARGAA